MREIFWPYSRKENLFGHHVLFDHFTKGRFIWITVEPCLTATLVIILAPQYYGHIFSAQQYGHT